MHICALPPCHPLYEVACHAAWRFIKSHRSPLHYLFFTTGLKPQDIETIDPVHRHPNYCPAMKTVICVDKESALTSANDIHTRNQYKVSTGGRLVCALRMSYAVPCIPPVMYLDAVPWIDCKDFVSATDPLDFCKWACLNGGVYQTSDA